MCFVRLCPTGFLAMAIAPWLSSMTLMGLLQFSSISASSLRNHTASCTAKLKAMQSASAVERETIGCLLLIQAIAPPLNVNRFPVVEC